MKMISILVAFCFYAAPLAAHEGGHDTRGVVVCASADELVVKTGHGEDGLDVWVIPHAGRVAGFGNRP